MFAVARYAITSRSRGGLGIDFDQIPRIDLQIKRYLRPLNRVVVCDAPRTNSGLCVHNRKQKKQQQVFLSVIPTRTHNRVITRH